MFFRNDERGSESLNNITETNRNYIHVVCTLFTRLGVARANIIDPNDSSLKKTIVVIKFGATSGVSIDENKCIPDNYVEPVSGEGKFSIKISLIYW